MAAVTLRRELYNFFRETGAAVTYDVRVKNKYLRNI